MNENQTEEELEKEIEEEKAASFFQTVPQRMDEEDPDNVLKRIEVNLEILSEKVTAAEDSRAMYESMVEFYNSSYINVIELSYSIWDSIPVTYDPITRFLLGDFPVIKTGFLALAGSTQISRMGSSPNLQRGCEPPEIR